jgi:hypothetical protein
MDWQEIPSCFGKSATDEECGKCECSHDCLFFRSVKNQEKLIESQIELQKSSIGYKMNAEQMVDFQHNVSLNLWLNRTAYICKSGVLQDILKDLIKQGFTKEEAFQILLRLI